jgi:hypothetical protein
MTAAERAAFITGLRKLTDALERDRGIPLPLEGSTTVLGIYAHRHDSGWTGPRLAAMVGSPGGEGWEQQVKPGSGITWLKITGRIAGLRVEINADADQVCEPIPPQPVIKRTCPALDALIAETRTGSAS